MEPKLTFEQFTEKLLEGEIRAKKEVYTSEDLHDEYVQYLKHPERWRKRSK